MLYLAIDQHREQLAANLRNEAGDAYSSARQPRKRSRRSANARKPAAPWATRLAKNA